MAAPVAERACVVGGLNLAVPPRYRKIACLIEGRLGGYIRMGIPERREAVAELTEEGMSTREIGEVLGVGNATVSRDQSGVPNETPKAEEVDDGGDTASVPVPNETPEPELPPVRDIPSVDELIADGATLLRRSKAQSMLSKAAAATNQLSPSIERMVSA